MVGLCGWKLHDAWELFWAGKLLGFGIVLLKLFFSSGGTWGEKGYSKGTPAPGTDRGGVETPLWRQSRLQPVKSPPLFAGNLYRLQESMISCKRTYLRDLRQPALWPSPLQFGANLDGCLDLNGGPFKELFWLDGRLLYPSEVPVLGSMTGIGRGATRPFPEGRCGGKWRCLGWRIWFLNTSDLRP